MNVDIYVYLCNMKSYTNDNIHKLTKTGGSSYYVVMPKHMIRELGWKERQKLKIKKRGKKITIEDWEK